MKRFLSLLSFLTLFIAWSYADPVARIFAYDLRLTTEGDNYTFSFRANEAPTEAALVFYSVGTGKIIGEKALDGIVKGANSVTLSRNELAGGGTMNWGVKLHAGAIASIAELTDNSTHKYEFYLPQGIAVNNCTESDYFGHMYITEIDGASDGMSDRTDTQKGGIFEYDLALNEVNPENEGWLPGGITAGSDRQEMKRITVDPQDGMIYFNRTTKIYKINPTDMTAATDILDGKAGITKVNACYAESGVVYFIDNANTSTGGTLKKITSDGTISNVLTSKLWGVQDLGFCSDGRGGFWVAQHRFDPSSDAFSALTHVTSAGTIDYSVNKNSSSTILSLFPAANGNAAYRGQVAYYSNEDLLAFGGNKMATIFKVTYDAATGAPTLVRWKQTGILGANIDGLSFDYAGNLYVLSASVERMYAFSVPTDNNECTVPAKKSLTVYKPIANPVIGVTLDVTSKTMVVGETFTLTPTIAPADATDKTYSWSTSDGSVATISDGLVTAVGVGTADITVTTTDGSFTATCAVTVEAPDPLSGTYKIGGAEADFASLHSATEYMRTWGISDDVTFLICDDLAETANSGLVNTTDYTITIRPDAAVKRTVSFGSSPDNIGPSGHIMIGYDLSGWASTDTKNIIIDGSFEGEGQYLEFQGGTIGGVVVVYYGKVTNSVVKNCRLISSRSTNTTYVVHFRSEKDSDKAPTGVGFENCYMEVLNAQAGQAVYFNGSQSSTAAGKPKDCYLRNCEIASKLRGIFFNGAINSTIEGNTFRIPAASAGYLAHGIMGNVQTGTIIVRGNKFIENKSTNASAGAFGLQTITASGGADVWVIENNFFGGMDASAAGVTDKSVTHTYVRCGDSCVVRHNTFLMPSLTNKPGTALVASQAISCLWLASANIKYPVENNIFITAEATANNSLIRGALNENCTGNVFYSAGGKGAIVAGALNCANWSDLCTKYSAQALTSTYQQVELTENYKPTSAYVDNVNLAVTPIAEVTTDIEGTTRNTTKTYAGCYEASNIAAIYTGVSSVVLPATASIERDNTLELTPTVTPAIAANRTQFWSSDNTAVATVDNSGVVTAVAVGTANITVTIDGVTSDPCTVTVYRTDFEVTWEPNGATTTSTAPASNEDLWTLFKPDYNTFYSDTRSTSITIANVATFAYAKMQEFMIDPASPWKWLGDYMLSVATAQGYTLDTEQKWRFCAQAFFNCAEANVYAINAPNFTIAGQIENWLPLWKQANNYLPPTMRATDEMPVIRKGNDLLAGWYDNSSFTGAPVTSVTADMTLYAKWIAPIELDEASADNIAKIEANDGELANVILRRTFEATGYWYTLVLPFDVSAEQMEETFGAGYEVTVLESSYRKSETAIYLKFVPQTYIKAGEPCLFKPGRDIEEAIFRGVTIDNTIPEVNTTIVNMVGLYAPTDVTLSDNNYYLGSTNYLHEYVAIYQNTKGFRAYFHFNEAMTAGCSARVVFREDTATELEDLPEVNTPAVQKVIRDGQLIIIREGKEYTTQGQHIQ